MLKETSYSSIHSFLASEHKIVLKGVIDSSLIIPDSEGHKRLNSGTVLGKVTATGKLGPYDDTKTDGREKAVGILINPVDLTAGDEMTVYLIHGAVTETGLTGIDTNGKADLANIIFI
jgi:hypothetical protein